MNREVNQDNTTRKGGSEAVVHLFTQCSSLFVLLLEGKGGRDSAGNSKGFPKPLGQLSCGSPKRKAIPECRANTDRS